MPHSPVAKVKGVDGGGLGVDSQGGQVLMVALIYACGERSVEAAYDYGGGRCGIAQITVKAQGVTF